MTESYILTTLYPGSLEYLAGLIKEFQQDHPGGWLSPTGERLALHGSRYFPYMSCLSWQVIPYLTDAETEARDRIRSPGQPLHDRSALITANPQPHGVRVAFRDGRWPSGEAAPPLGPAFEEFADELVAQFPPTATRAHPVINIVAPPAPEPARKQSRSQDPEIRRLKQALIDEYEKIRQETGHPTKREAALRLTEGLKKDTIQILGQPGSWVLKPGILRLREPKLLYGTLESWKRQIAAGEIPDGCDDVGM